MQMQACRHRRNHEEVDLVIVSDDEFICKYHLPICEFPCIFGKGVRNPESDIVICGRIICSKGSF